MKLLVRRGLGRMRWAVSQTEAQGEMAQMGDSTGTKRWFGGKRRPYRGFCGPERARHPLSNPLRFVDFDPTGLLDIASRFDFAATLARVEFHDGLKVPQPSPPRIESVQSPLALLTPPRGPIPASKSLMGPGLGLSPAPTPRAAMFVCNRLERQ